MEQNKIEKNCERNKLYFTQPKYSKPLIISYGVLAIGVILALIGYLSVEFYVLQYIGLGVAAVGIVLTAIFNGKVVKDYEIDTQLQVLNSELQGTGFQKFGLSKSETLDKSFPFFGYDYQPEDITLTRGKDMVFRTQYAYTGALYVTSMRVLYIKWENNLCEDTDVKQTLLTFPLRQLESIKYYTKEYPGLEGKTLSLGFCDITNSKGETVTVLLKDDYNFVDGFIKLDKKIKYDNEKRREKQILEQKRLEEAAKAQ